MTLCIAALCEDRRTLVLVADKMLGVGFIQSELDIEKTFSLHKDWWVMVAGNDITPAFDIIDAAKQRLQDEPTHGVDDVIREITDSYQRRRLKAAEAQHLRPHGWTVERFVTEGPRILPESVFKDIDFDIQHHQLNVSLLGGGFDDAGQGHIFSIDNPGVASRHDIPGFHAIGSGMFGALFMMYYRELSAAMPADWCLYYAFEAKSFGEQAGGVGEQTDMYIARYGQPVARVGATMMQRLLQLWEQFRPPWPTKRAVGQLRRFSEMKSSASQFPSD